MTPTDVMRLPMFDVVQKLSPALSNPATMAQYAIAYEAFGRWLRSGHHVLDWGCGHGHIAFALKGCPVDVTGYSLGPPPLLTPMLGRNFSHVRGTHPIELPFVDNSFDVVLNCGVLEHVHQMGGNDIGSLREIARVMKPSATFLTFHLPNTDGWVERVGAMLGANEQFHDRKYDASMIRDLWAEAGLRVIASKRYNFLPRNQLRKLPDTIKHNRAFVDIYNTADAALAAIAPHWCTNWYVVATVD